MIKLSILAKPPLFFIRFSNPTPKLTRPPTGWLPTWSVVKFLGLFRKIARSRGSALNALLAYSVYVFNMITVISDFFPWDLLT